MSQTKHHTSLGAVLNWPATLLSWLAWRFARVNRYEIDGETIMFWRGPFSRRTIDAREVRGWSVHGEMGFDLVHIIFTDDTSVSWIDKYGDLLAALRKVASTKEEY